MRTDEILQKYGHHKELLLKILHEIQEANPHKHVSAEAIREVAKWLNLPLSSVYGVLKYYSMYSTEPRGKHIIRVCNSVVCMMHDSKLLMNNIETMVNSADLQSHEDPLFTIETTECLGHCEAAPAIMIDEEIMGPVNEQDVCKMINQLKSNSK